MKKIAALILAVFFVFVWVVLVYYKPQNIYTYKGVVLTESGKPIHGVEVVYYSASSENEKTTTDASGKFQLKTNMANIAKVDANKIGYDFFFVGDGLLSAQDHNFIGWQKKNLKTKQVYRKSSYAISTAPRVVQLDEGVSVLVAIRNESARPTMKVSVLDGGLIQYFDSFPRQAPQSGYLNEVGISPFDYEGRHYYFYADGVHGKQYGWIELYFRIKSDNTSLLDVFAWGINMDGGRGLYHEHPGRWMNEIKGSK